MRSLLAQNKHLLFYASQLPSYFKFKFKFLTKHHYHCSPSSLSSPTFLLGNDTSTIAHTVHFSARSSSSVLGTLIHSHIIKLGLSNDIFSYNNLIRMYCKCGFYSDARNLFDEMPNRNLVSWTLIISGANHNGLYQEALITFLDMIRSGFLPNEFALGSIMKACTSIGAEEFSLCIHCFALKIRMDKNPFVGSSILNMYAKRGIINSAESVFAGMDSFDVGCWNAMIGGYAQCGYGSEAVKALSFMHSEGLPMDEFTFINALTGCSVKGDLNCGSQIHGLIIQNGLQLNTSVVNSLTDMYFKICQKDIALQLFYAMEDKDIVSWNTVFAGFCQDESAREVVNLFHHFMVTGLKPNHITFSILFRVCGDVHELDLGLQFFDVAFRLGLHVDTHVSTSIISMLSRCGATKMARSLFNSLPSINVNILNEMISGYNLSCDSEALELFCNMQHSGVETNECTYSCALEACFKTDNVQAIRQLHGIIVKSGFSSNGICL